MDKRYRNITRLLGILALLPACSASLNNTDVADAIQAATSSAGTSSTDGSADGDNGSGSGDSTTVSLSVDNGSFTTSEGTVKTGTLPSTYNGSSTLTFSIVANGSKGTVTLTNATNGEISYTPSGDNTGTDTFTFQVTDGSLTSTTGTFTVTITEVNDNPTVSDVTAKATNYNTLINVPFLVDEGGGTDEDAQALTVTATSDNQTLVPNSAIVVNYTDNGASSADALSPSLDITPAKNGPGGTATITITATDDGTGTLAATDTFVLTVNAMTADDTPGLLAWFDPELGVTRDSQNYVTAWADQKTSTRVARPFDIDDISTPTTYRQAPKWVDNHVNSRDMIYFAQYTSGSPDPTQNDLSQNGYDESLEMQLNSGVGDNNIIGGQTVVLVGQFDGAQDWAYLYSGTDDWQLMAMGYSASINGIATSYLDGAWYHQPYQFNTNANVFVYELTTTLARSWVNGVPNGYVPGTHVVGQITSIGGADGGNMRFLKGYIGDFYVYDRLLPAEDRRALEAMLGVKYNIDVANMITHLDAEEGITIDTGVSVWADQSGNGNNATQSTGARQPVVGSNVINSLDTIDFAGGDKYLELAGVTIDPASASFTMGIAFNTATKGETLISHLDGAGTGYRVLANSSTGDGDDLKMFSEIGGSPQYSTNTYTLSAWWNYLVRWDQTNLDYTYGRAAAGSPGAADDGGLTPTALANDGAWRIGIDKDGTSNGFTGDIPEIIIYDDAMTAEQHKSLSCYFAYRYGWQHGDCD